MTKSSFDGGDKMNPLAKLGIAVGSILVLGIVIWVIVAKVFFFSVSPGNVGIILQYSFDGKPQITVIQPGSNHFVNPFGGQQAITYPIAQQQLVLSSQGNEGELQGNTTIACQMSGGGTIHFGFNVTWQVDSQHPQTLYLKKPNTDLTSTLNNDINTTLVYSAVQSDVLTTCTQYTWENILGDGTGASQEPQFTKDILAALQRDLSPDGILVNQVFIKEHTPDSGIQAVLAARNAAQKSAFLQQEAQYQAQAQVAQAQGQAQAIAIINKQLAQSPLYLQYLMIQDYFAKWDGHLPQVMSNGNGGIMLVPSNVPSKVQ